MAASPEPSTRSRRRWLGVLLVLGCVAALAPVATKLPQERRVELRFGHADRPGRVVLSWFEGADLIRRTELSRAAGEARLETRLDLQDGSYRLELTVLEGERVAHSSERLVVFDEGVDNVTIPLP